MWAELSDGERMPLSSGADAASLSLSSAVPFVTVGGAAADAPVTATVEVGAPLVRPRATASARSWEACGGATLANATFPLTIDQVLPLSVNAYTGSHLAVPGSAETEARRLSPPTLLYVTIIVAFEDGSSRGLL